MTLDAPNSDSMLKSEKRRTRGHLDSYGDDRECAADDCTTVLSKYNEGPYCWGHSAAKPNRA